MNGGFFDSLVEKSFALIDLPQSNRKHFSFIVRRTKIVSFGWNMAKKTHPWAAKYGKNIDYPFIHSELAAIKNFPFPPIELEKCSLINTRVCPSGKIRISKPCEHCMNLLDVFSFKHVYYTDDEGKFIEL